MPDPGSSKDLMAPGRMWEESGDYSKAIDAYLKVTSEQTKDHDHLEVIWEKAVDLALNHVTGRIGEVVNEVSKRLVEIGRFEQAAEFLEGIDSHRDAIDVYLRAGMFDKAREVCKHAPQFAEYVDSAAKHGGGGGGGYTPQGRGRGGAAQGSMLGDDMGGLPGSGSGGGGDDLKALAKRGDWERCLQVATKAGPEALDQYVILHAVALLRSNHLEDAVGVLQKHNTPLGSSNLQLYRQIARDLLGRGRKSSEPDGVWLPHIQNLREVLFKIWTALKAHSSSDAQDLREFERCIVRPL